MNHCLRMSAALGALLLAGSLSARAESVTYTLDPKHTDIVVTWTHFGLSHPRAMFNHVSGTVTYDPDHPEQSSVQATIPVSSVHTASPKLDEHIQSGDFFAADTYPDITFKSTRVVAGDKDGTLKVTGDLTAHGKTHPVTLDVTVNKLGTQPMGKARAAAFDASTTIKRSDFGVDLYAPMVSDEVRLTLTTEAVESQDDTHK